MKKRSDKLFEKKKTYNGKAVHFYGKTEADVVDKIREYERGINEKKTFKKVAEEWRDKFYPTIVPKTQIGYEPSRKRAIEYFGEMYLDKITTGQIQTFIDDFARKGYSRQSVNTQLIVIKGILRQGVLDNLISINPANEVKIPRGLNKEKRKPPCDDDIERIKKYWNIDFGLFACIMLYTGMRPGEIRALTWEDIDLENKLININKAITTDIDGNTPILKQTKTVNGIRMIPILDPLLNIFNQIDMQKQGIVFPGLNKDYLTETAYKYRWKKYKKETGVKFTPYQIRHAFSTMLYEAGVPDKDAQMLMGHSSIIVTRDVYTTIRQRQQDKTVNKLNGFLNNII